jgi:hypothetical protein
LTTELLTRIPADRIEARARRAPAPHIAVLNIIMAVLFGLGYAAASSWFAVVWCGSAVAEGWVTARKAQRARTA